MTRVTVFVDYQNAYMRAREALGTSRSDPYTFGQIDPRRLGALLEAKGRVIDAARALVEVRVYRGEPDARRSPSGHAACRRQVQCWAEQVLVIPRTRPVQYRPTAWDLAGRVTSWEVREKGIDVLLAVEMAMGAMRDEYDVAVLVSEDTDLLPAVEAVIDLGKRVEVASWRAHKRRGPRLTLPKRNLWCHWLDHADFDRVRDDTDYTRPVRRTTSRDLVERAGKLPRVDE
jgi:uncharacterized LabA/DUF88 family protein